MTNISRTTTMLVCTECMHKGMHSSGEDLFLKTKTVGKSYLVWYIQTFLKTPITPQLFYTPFCTPILCH